MHETEIKMGKILVMRIAFAIGFYLGCKWSDRIAARKASK